MLGLIDDHDIEPEWNPPGCSPELQKVDTAFASAHSHVHHSAELQKVHTAFASAHLHVHHSAELQKVHTAFASDHSHVYHSAEQSCTLHNLTDAQPFRYAFPLQAQRAFSQATWSHNSMTLHAMDALVATVLKTLVVLRSTYRNNTSI